MIRKNFGKIGMLLASSAMVTMLAFSPMADAAEWTPSEPGDKLDMTATTLITNVSIFNGTDETLITGKDVFPQPAMQQDSSRTSQF